MKTIFTILSFFVAISISVAQVPPSAFNYSGVARNPQGNPIANTTIGIQISILKTSTVGPIQYQENHFVNTDAFGLFNLVIGAGAVQQGSMAAIEWGIDNYYLKVGMDATGGTNFLTMGTTQLLSVPYALYAQKAENITGTITETDPVFSASVAAGITSADTAKWNVTGILSETDPIWTANSGNYYTKTQMQTSGLSQLHFNNITYKPTTLAGYGIIDAVNNFGNQVIEGDKTFGGLPLFMNGIKFSDNTILNTGNIGKWTFDGTNNTSTYPVYLPQSGIELEKLIKIGDYDANSHTNQYENDIQAAIIYSRYFYGHYGDLIIQGMSKGYTTNIHFVTGSTEYGADPPTQRMVVMANGNVGVGNFVSSPPKARLDVKGGDVYISDITKGIILKSPNGQCWRVTIDNTGNLIRTSITCP